MARSLFMGVSYFVARSLPLVFSETMTRSISLVLLDQDDSLDPAGFLCYGDSFLGDGFLVH